MDNNKIDQVIFSRLGETQTYAGVLCQNGVPVRKVHDCMGGFINDMVDVIKVKYPNIEIKMK